MAQTSEDRFFEREGLSSFLRKPFDVGMPGVEVTGAPPLHRSGSSGPDNGAIPRLRRIRDARHTHDRADDIGALFDWTTKGQPRFVHLLGHGAGGLFDVGDGQNRITTAGCLHVWNRYYWAAHLERTSKYDENRQVKVPDDGILFSGALMLEGCCVAEGSEGRRFMKELADTTLRTVFAYTGLITVRAHSVWFQKGHAWIRQDPLASQSTVEVQQLDKSLVRSTTLGASGLGDGREPDDIESFEVTSLLHSATVRIAPDHVAALVRELFHSASFKPDGAPAGILTHRIDIRFRSSAPLAVNVYARRLAMVEDGPAYLVGPQFDRLLEVYFKAGPPS